ncbi:hypothetical protein DL93DRAFT_2162020 [Clavulina sp. PMI_390]|nr:hypothetical protein DL93DRAFT_2162020 [Clavulina sp. PMI_390]
MTSISPFPFCFVGDGVVDEDANEWMRQVKLFALGRSDADKVKVFELCLAPNSPAEAWFDGLNPEKLSFKAICQAFQKTFTTVQYTPLPAWIPLERLEMCLLREEDIGREVVEAGTGLVLPAHVHYARRIQKLAMSVPDDEAMLVANARHRLPPSVRAIVPKHVKSWESFVDAILQVPTVNLLRIQERAGGVPTGAAAGAGGYGSASSAAGGRHDPHRRMSYSRTTSGTGSGLPAPHVVEFSATAGDVPTSAIPAHVSSSENSPTGTYPNGYSPTRNMSHGARQYYPSGTSPTHVGGPNGAVPYDRNTPSAPPQTRTWLRG